MNRDNPDLVQTITRPRNIAIIAILALVVVGCLLFARIISRVFSPAPSATPLSEGLPKLPLTPSPTALFPTSESATGMPLPSEAAATQTEATTETNMPAETTPECSPPAGWVLHRVRSGETLYYLASSVDISVSELMEANCLDSDFLQIDQPIYLPSLPPERPTQPPPPPPQPEAPVAEATPTTCLSPFSCPLVDLPPLVLEPGAPNDPGFIPCQGTVGSPWLHTDDDRREIGERFYFFACEYPSQPTLATITGPGDFEQNVMLLPENPNPDWEKGGEQAVVVWPALPNLATGFYILEVQDADGNGAQVAFIIDKPTIEHILISPLSGPPGTTFTINYINFELGSTLRIDMFGEDNPVTGEAHTMSGRISWSVTIDKAMRDDPEKGWTEQLLNSVPDDPTGAYLLAYNNFGVTDTFWLR